MNITRLLHDAHLRYQRNALRAEKGDVSALPCPNLRGERVKPSASQVAMRNHASKMSASYYKLFCDHDIPRWLPCSASLCKRDNTECQRFITRLAKGQIL